MSNDAESELSSLREELADTGSVELQLATDSEWRMDLTAGEHGQNFKDLLRETECDVKFEDLQDQQAAKGKRIEGVKLHIQHANGVVDAYDSLAAAFDYVLQAGDRLKITYKIGNNC